MDLNTIAQVVFDAAPVACQGGRPNYTVWFMADWDCANPFRKGGYLSVTLNSPYTEMGTPRREVIDPVINLYRRYCNDKRVFAEPGFLHAIA